MYRDLSSLEQIMEGVEAWSWDTPGEGPPSPHDIALRAVNVAEPEDVLQTKIVPVAEVAANIQRWTPTLGAELESITTEHRAGTVISNEQADRLESNPDLDIVKIPGKIVATIRRQKCRVVACGNYLQRPKERKSPTLDRRDIYSAGLDTISLRSQIATAAHNGWIGATIDVKTAFLTAPYQPPRAQRKESKKRVVLVRVPRVMVLAGQRAAGSKWKAVTVGTLGVYVDDLLVMSEKGHLDAALAALQSLWQTSKPEYISQKGGLCFCGLQIEQVEDVIKIHQRTYLCELRDRYPELVPKAALPEFRGEPLDEQPCPEAIHAAQRIIGELTWVAGRTRPDIAFHVNRISRMTARYPSQALGLGKHVLQYLLATIDFAICYCPTPVVPKSMLDELPVHPAPDVFQIWADASFAQADARSQTGVMITLNLQPLAWISVQQPYVALSTCESELVASTEDKVELKSLYIPGGPLLFKLLVCAIIQPVSAQ
ncbi:RE2, partial [Symbiodinium pilosum]